MISSQFFFFTNWKPGTIILSSYVPKYIINTEVVLFYKDFKAFKMLVMV